MTSNDINRKITEWVGSTSAYEYSSKGHTPKDFYNSNAAAIELLPILVEKGYQFCLEDSPSTTKEKLFRFAIYKAFQDRMLELSEVFVLTISEAICEAIIQLIESEAAMSRVKGFTTSSYITSEPLTNKDIYVEEIPKEALQCKNVETIALGGNGLFLDVTMPDGIGCSHYDVILIPVGKP